MAEELSPREAEMAARFEAEVGVRHIAEVYAEALLGAAEAAGETEAVLAEFGSFLADVLDRFPKLETILGSGFIAYEEKAAILDRILEGRASKLFLNFLKVLARHGRLDALRPVYRQARESLDRLRGRVRVEVITAAPLDPAQTARIAEGIRGLVPGEPVLQPVVDPGVIGGLVVRVGDTVYDGSVATQLEKIRQQMIDRSAHEIQSRRDRFRYPAGN